MKKYEILSREDFNSFVETFTTYYDNLIIDNLPFKPVNIQVKSWRKDRTPQQLKFYWVCINELRKGFKNVGYEFTREELHETMKIKQGFTVEKILPNNDIVLITKSISDNSKDIDTNNMNELIDFIIRYAAINIDYHIQDPRL